MNSIMNASVPSESCVMKWRRIIFIILFGVWNLMACTRYLDSGEMVRHHFGYVRIVTPAVHAPETAVRILDIETYGLWFYWDTRSQGEDAAGYGTGLGYSHDHRELIPLDCRIIFRVKNKQQIQYILQTLREMNISEGGICAIQDLSASSQD